MLYFYLNAKLGELREDTKTELVHIAIASEGSS